MPGDRARHRAQGSLRSYLELVRWLGPWADAARAPAGVWSSRLTVPPRAPGERPFELALHQPRGRAPSGAYLVAPGLHFLGPADPRLDRFLRVLAAAGFLVAAPFLPDYTALRVDERVVDDLGRAWDLLLGHPDRPKGVAPGVFSISFGSLPALRLAADAARGPGVGALAVFGGYADFGDALHFCLGGGDGRPRDPLNQPVVLMNLVERLPGAPANPERLCAAWRRYVEATWGRPEMKRRERWEPVARALAAELAPSEVELFLVGCGALPGAAELCAPALAALPPFMDPRPHLGAIRCPVYLFHGVDDDVIPATHMEQLAALLAPHTTVRVHLTGLYGHTGSAGLAGSIPLLARELATLARMLDALVRAGGARWE